MPQQLVPISGRVQVPGDYPLEPGMTVMRPAARGRRPRLRRAFTKGPEPS